MFFQYILFNENNNYNKTTSWKVHKKPFPRIPYAESLDKYGTDKPDLRNPLIIEDCTKVFLNSNFKIFKSYIRSDKHVAIIVNPKKMIYPS